MFHGVLGILQSFRGVPGDFSGVLEALEVFQGCSMGFQGRCRRFQGHSRGFQKVSGVFQQNSERYRGVPGVLGHCRSASGDLREFQKSEGRSKEGFQAVARYSGKFPGLSHQFNGNLFRTIPKFPGKRRINLWFIPESL